MSQDSKSAVMAVMMMFLSGIASMLSTGRSYASLAWLEIKVALLERRNEKMGFMQDDTAVMREARMIGGALIMLLVITLVLTEVYAAINIEENSTWYPIVEALETTGVSSVVLLVVGLLVIAASAVMRFFQGGFGGGR
ncbi:hypothetical protein SAMN06269185_1063 [Natronoarchaeum philippinense]|uniref:Uncharacterized protein n=1 Tax=Natronoarchaeum philippinense TaxID=558529 RepID=A0A285N9N9_NATPI|nr:hypothetical protein [Natronoarchaeum philippinense]SNZ06140.1 hypothetical protein SAMN06269185_1063 [Natronoarchaeum philippinense]